MDTKLRKPTKPLAVKPAYSVKQRTDKLVPKMRTSTKKKGF